MQDPGLGGLEATTVKGTAATATSTERNSDRMPIRVETNVGGQGLNEGMTLGVKRSRALFKTRFQEALPLVGFPMPDFSLFLGARPSMTLRASRAEV